MDKIVFSYEKLPWDDLLDRFPISELDYDIHKDKSQ